MAKVSPQVAGFSLLFRGLGRLFLDQGNQNNEPAPPPVQMGTYEFIQNVRDLFPSQAIVNVPVVPPAFRDWAQYGVNYYDLSGLEGGGSTGDVPQETNGPVLYYDDTTGIYVDLTAG